MEPKLEAKLELKPEPEHEGSVWTHPYLIYILLTVVLFLMLIGMGWLAWTQGWIPTR